MASVDSYMSVPMGSLFEVQVSESVTLEESPGICMLTNIQSVSNKGFPEPR